MNADTEVSKIFRLKDTQAKALKKLGLITLRDLLYHFPSRYGHEAAYKESKEAEDSELVTLVGRIKRAKAKKTWKSRVPATEASFEDESGTVSLLFLHQPYIAKQYPENTNVELRGKVKVGDNGKRSMINPEIKRSDISNTRILSGSNSTQASIYPESRGVTSLWLSMAIGRLIKEGVLDTLEDPLPSEILEKYKLPDLRTALFWIHTPRDKSDSEVARKRFAFEEVFLLQLSRGLAKKEYKSGDTHSMGIDKKLVDQFVKSFPFKATGAQERAIETILADLKSDEPMTRLLEGDVGSGKTAVAAAITYGMVKTSPYGKDFGNLQVAIMAPTEILARQHFESFIEMFEGHNIQVGLITGNECLKYPAKAGPDPFTKISRSQLLKWVKNGEIPILVGTHALIQKSVEFKHLGLVIVDEQHRFGIKQRATLASKHDKTPHLLSMTATPIPRTLALTIYGDLDLTLLDELPAGRKQVKTELVDKDDRSTTEERIVQELKAGRQAYVICPRIDEPDPTKEMALNLKSVKEESERLQKGPFKDYKVDIVHSKMKPADKEAVMESFANGEVDVLVATSVVEVGVNVPNATVIVIEGADRFGLSQLHQLRGRVQRSSHQSYCYLYSESKSNTSRERLKALVEAASGFDLAELDLKLRGAGSLVGTRQWGISDVAMESLQNLKMVEAARKEAQTLISRGASLSAALALRLEGLSTTHLE